VIIQDSQVKRWESLSKNRTFKMQHNT
jgi:hypothetical protein